MRYIIGIIIQFIFSLALMGFGGWMINNSNNPPATILGWAIVVVCTAHILAVCYFSTWLPRD